MDSQPDFSDTDVDYILDTVIKILEKMNEEEMKFLSKKTNLQKLMTKKPFVVNENMPASKALAIMNEKKNYKFTGNFR